MHKLWPTLVHVKIILLVLQPMWVMVPFLPHPLHHPLITMGDEGSTGEGGRAGGGEGPPEDMELLLV